MQHNARGEKLKVGVFGEHWYAIPEYCDFSGMQWMWLAIEVGIGRRDGSPFIHYGRETQRSKKNIFKNWFLKKVRQGKSPCKWAFVIDSLYYRYIEFPKEAYELLVSS